MLICITLERQIHVPVYDDITSATKFGYEGRPLDSFNTILPPERHWRGPRSQEVREERDCTYLDTVAIRMISAIRAAAMRASEGRCQGRKLRGVFVLFYTTVAGMEVPNTRSPLSD